MRVAPLLGVVALLAALALVAPGAADAARPAYFKDPLDGSTRQRPAVITFRDLQLRGLRWTGWGSAKATAGGRVRMLVCQPTCADGRIVSGRAGVTVYRLQRHGARRYYTCVRARFAGLPRGLPAYMYRLRPFCQRIG